MATQGRVGIFCFGHILPPGRLLPLATSKTRLADKETTVGLPMDMFIPSRKMWIRKVDSAWKKSGNPLTKLPKDTQKSQTLVNGNFAKIQKARNPAAA